MLYVDRQYDRAIAQLQKTIETHPRFWIRHNWLGLIASRLGEHSEAVSECSRAVELSGDLPLAVASLGHVQALSGDRDGATRTLERLMDLSKRRYVMPYGMALVYSGMGDQERTLEWLERGCAEHGSLMCFLSVDPSFEVLWPHPRFQDLLRRVGLPSR